jgi:Na+/H+ antiporter NhaD/arsenite permease-like protein
VIASILLVGVLVVSLIAQAARPQSRLLIVGLGAAVSGLLATVLGVTTSARLMGDVPWGVLGILVGLGLLAEMLAASRVFGLAAVAVAEVTQGRPNRLLLCFAAVMFAVSAVVNNLTALLLILPPMLVLLRALGVGQRYLTWSLGILLVACNLGGAATPIGDFPAILLLGRGALDFGTYLVHALPAAGIALFVLLAVVQIAVGPARGERIDPAVCRVSVALMQALHRRIGIDWSILLPAMVVLVAMIVAWTVLPASTGVTAELVCWLGVLAALFTRARMGEQLLRTRVDVEAALFLLALFVMVGAVRETGVFDRLSHWLVDLPLAPLPKLMVFLTASALLTGLFSAAPTMAALLEVAPSLTADLPRTAVYVGLALAVCAGSSLFLTAATSGPLAQALAERAGLKGPDGAPLRFGFREFLPVGLLSFAIILAVALLAAYTIATMPSDFGIP